MNTDKNIIDKLIDAKIVDNAFHASGMLNVLQCVTLANDEQRLERCRLYVAWKKYYGNSKDFTNQMKAKAQARKNAIAGLPVPELPMVLETSWIYLDEHGKDVTAEVT